MTLFVEPVAKPRMTRSDKWKRRPCVTRYRAYKDELRDLRAPSGTQLALVFRLTMPASWPRAKRDKHRGQPHQAKPDVDNLVKGYLDAVLADDSTVWRVTAEKRWADAGSITVEAMP